MGLVKAIGSLLPAALKTRIRDAAGSRYQAPSMRWSLANLRRLGFAPRAIVDAGAYVGEWSVLAHGIFPEATFLLIEPQESRRAALSRLVASRPSTFRYEPVLLGAEADKLVEFHVYEQATTASSVLPDQRSSPARLVSQRLETLDRLLQRTKFPAPELIKLDVQGYELEILRGGEESLRSVQAIILEVSFIELYQNVPLLHDVTDFLHRRGYRAYDICGLMRRPLDDALCQVDMIFVKESSPLLANKNWQANSVS